MLLRLIILLNYFLLISLTWLSLFWYAFQPGHHFVCHLQIFAISESGFFSENSRHLQFSHPEIIIPPPSIYTLFKCMEFDTASFMKHMMPSYLNLNFLYTVQFIKLRTAAVILTWALVAAWLHDLLLSVVILLQGARCTIAYGFLSHQVSPQ